MAKMKKSLTFLGCDVLSAPLRYCCAESFIWRKYFLIYGKIWNGLCAKPSVYVERITIAESREKVEGKSFRNLHFK
jgi:hypothetical protein